MKTFRNPWLHGAALALTLCAMSPVHAERLKRVELPIDMSKLDTNKDGKLSKAEANVSPTLLDDWPARDTNGDGLLDSTELAAKAPADANGGGSAGGGGEGGSSGSSASGSGS